MSIFTQNFSEPARTFNDNTENRLVEVTKTVGTKIGHHMVTVRMLLANEMKVCGKGDQRAPWSGSRKKTVSFCFRELHTTL